jgi:SAM-dependent methyltransferase
MVCDGNREAEAATIADVSLAEGCVCCGPDRPFTEHQVKEGMYLTGEIFTYRECLECGSLQIAEVPSDLGRYYPADYHSLTIYGAASKPILRTRPARAALRANTSLYLCTGLGRGKWWTRVAGIKTRDSILDLGCGAGKDVLGLYLLGFKHVTGADPFLSEDQEIAPGVRLWKKTHAEIDGSYDWIMMHHMFEHAADPRATLRSCRRLLNDGGRVLMRIPFMGKAAWRMYRTNWVQIDPPRHIVIYSPRGLMAMAEAEGLRVESMFYDSSAFQFWGSECVAAGRPYLGWSDVTAEQMGAWNREAQRLNRAHDGDQGGFVLSRA